MKYFLPYVIAFFLFANIAPHFAFATSGDDVAHLNDTPLGETSVDGQLIQEETEDLFGETVEEENVEIESEIKGDTATIETTIETNELAVEGELELDLDTSEIQVTAEMETEDGEVIKQDFDVVVNEVNGDDFTATLTDTESGEQYHFNTAEVQASWYPLIIIAIHIARYGITYAVKKYGKSAVTNATKKYGKKATTKDLTKLKFAKGELEAHYKKHKREYGNISQSEYLKKAQALAGTTGKHILTKKRSNGDILKYNTKTNDYLALDKNDRIKTFFKPSQGIKYWNRQ